MEKVKEFFKRLGVEILKFLKQVVIIFTKYVIANVIDSILVGILMLILMLIFRMPHPIILSILSGFMNAIPAIGPVIGAVIGMTVLVFTDWKMSLLFMVLTIAVQAVDSYVIKPKLFGDTMGVHPVIMLIIMLAASLIGGIPGALLAAPIAGVVMFIIRSYIKPGIKKLKEHKKKPEILRIDGPTIYDIPEPMVQAIPEQTGNAQSVQSAPVIEQQQRVAAPVVPNTNVQPQSVPVAPKAAVQAQPPEPGFTSED